jgi:hypothetical protein
MQIVPDNLNIRTGYHVFETPEDICINSQIYDKITMEPKPYNFFNTNQCLTNKNLLLYECNILEYSWTMITREPDYEYYIQDNQDSDLFYYVTEISAGDQNQYVCKAQKVETGWKILKSISPDSGNRWGRSTTPFAGDSRSSYLHYKLLGQTNEYIICIQHHSGIDNGHFINVPRRQVLNYICIKKSDMSVKAMTIDAYLNFSVYKLKEDDDQIYLYERQETNLNIIRLDPYTNTRIVLHSIPDLGSWDSIGISNMIKFRDKYYVLTRNSSENGYAFQILDINFEYNTVSRTTKNLPDITEFPYKRATTRSDSLDGGWLQIDLKNIDDQYIAITSHDNRNHIHSYGYTGRQSGGEHGSYWITHEQTVSSAAGYHRHALVKYDADNDSWISKGIITPDESNQHIYGVIYYDQYTPIFFMNKRIIGYRLDLTTEKYNKCFEVAGTFYTIGLDENNKFYTFDNSNVCRIYNDVTSYLLDAQFEKSSYNYNNTDISTYVTIYSKNFVNEYIKTKVKITIEGNCKFTSNGKKELITYTSASGPINVDVTVTYGGTMYCYIKEVE